MKKSAPHPATRKTPRGGTVGRLVGVCLGKERRRGRTEDCDEDQQDSFDHLCDWLCVSRCGGVLAYALAMSVVFRFANSLFAFCIARWTV